MTTVLTKAMVAIAGGLVGLALVFSGLATSGLIEESARRANAEPMVGQHVLVMMMAGVLLLTVGVFSSLTLWSGHLRLNPRTRQAPPWVLMVIMVGGGAMGLIGYAAHMGDITESVTVPTSIDGAFIAGQVLAGAAVVGALVALGVRWTPRHRPARAKR